MVILRIKGAKACACSRGVHAQSVCMLKVCAW